MSVVRWALVLLAVASTSACVTRSVRVPAAAPGASSPRVEIARLLSRQPDFGSLSVIPVRFENSRIAGPFEENKRTYYCVRTEMHGRSFGKPERPKALVRQDARQEGTTLTVSNYDVDICSGHKSEDFPEFDGSHGRES